MSLPSYLRARLPWLALAIVLFAIIATGLAVGAGFAQSKTNAITPQQASSIEQGDTTSRRSLVDRFGEPRTVQLHGVETCYIWGRDGRLANEYHVCLAESGRVKSVTEESAGAGGTVKRYAEALRDSWTL